MVSRLEITRTVLERLPGSDHFGLDQATVSWYYNIRHSGGMRLTDAGLTAMRMARLESWTVPIKNRVDKRILMHLDRKIQFPYYLDQRHRLIHFFSSREAVMASLYGDISKWLDSMR